MNGERQASTNMSQTETRVELDMQPEPSEIEIRQQPWKYIGYKDLTSYMASESDFFAVRRFDRLHTRAILTLQAQLEHTEERLDHMDRVYSSKCVKAVGAGPPEVISVPATGLSQDEQKALDERHGDFADPRHINNGTVRDDMPQRLELLAEITEKLGKYGVVPISCGSINHLSLNSDQLLLNYSQLHSNPKAPKWNVQNVKNWFTNNQFAIMENETHFIEHKEELLALSSDKPSLRRLFEQDIVYRTGRSLGLFKKQPRHITTRDQKDVYAYDDEAIERAASIVCYVAALVVLIAPLWILQALNRMYLKLGVITIFVVVCMSFLSYAAVGKPFERLAVTAA